MVHSTAEEKGKGKNNTNTIVNMVNASICVQNVVCGSFVPMGRRNITVGDVAVEGCARPHIVQP